MHPGRSAQSVLLCDSCKTVPLQSHCELCDFNLCINCVGKHLVDASKRHNVVPFKQKKFTPHYPECPKHGGKHWELYCEKCEIPVCSACISRQQRGHILCDFLEKINSKTQALQNDLKELEFRIYPRYEEMASNVQDEKTELKTNYEKLTRDVDQQGEILHREVTAIVNQRKSDIAEMKSKHMDALDRITDVITHNITELKQIIVNLKAMLKSNDIFLISSYRSRKNEFRKLPLKVQVTLPRFFPQKANTEQLHEMFGSLSALSINTEEHGDTIKFSEATSIPPVKPMTSPDALSSPPDKPIKSPVVVSSLPVKQMTSSEDISSPPIKPMKTPVVVSSLPIKPMASPETLSSPPVKPMKSPEDASFPPVKLLLDKPRFTATIDTGFDEYGLRSVSCLGEDEFWTCGDNKTMKFLNIKGKQLSSIQTKSGYRPWDIAVTRHGDLVYTDYDHNTINIVKNTQMCTMITLQGWIPLYICRTIADDLLVTMISDDDKQSKVVRYSGSTEIQTIQFDDQARPLYSSDYYDKYICENRNLDICVADRSAAAVVVVNHSGKLRFRYTGHPSNTKEFYPYGITTDSQSHILIADINGRIHILDQDGQFLRYICNLHSPYGLCVDIRDNLFVAEWSTAKVKKIQHLHV